MTIQGDVKAALRISASTTAYDTEIADLVATAQADLVLAGVLSSKVEDTTDPLIKRAITAYCKAHFGWNNPDAERLTRAYEMLKTHLILSGEYCGYTVTFTVTCGGSPVVGAEITFDGRELLTNASGVAVFAGVRPESQMEYTVTAKGYSSAEDIALDVDGDETVAVALTGE